MNGREGAYETLGVSRFACLETIHQAYRSLARRYHPDGATPDSTRFIEINRAYTLLKAGHGGSLHDVPDRGPLGRRIAAARGDSPTLDFGRYAGWRIADLVDWDPGYLRWLSRQTAGVRYRDVIGTLIGDESGPGWRATWPR